MIFNLYIIYKFSCKPAESSTCHPPLSNTHFAITGSELINERSEVFDEFNQLEELEADDDCIEILTILDCVLSQPACNPDTGRVTPICPELCPEIDQSIADSCANQPFVNDTIQFPHINSLIQFNCSDPESYFNFPSSYFSNPSNDCLFYGKSHCTHNL